MRRISQAYRVLVVISLTSFAWAIALPVVHLACAMEMESLSIGRPTGSDDHCTRFGGDGTTGRQDGTAPDDPRSGIDPSTAGVSCCLVETAPIERTAAPATHLMVFEINVAHVDAPSIVSADLRSFHAPVVSSAPPLPSRSHLFFSVLLI